MSFRLTATKMQRHTPEERKSYPVQINQGLAMMAETAIQAQPLSVATTARDVLIETLAQPRQSMRDCGQACAFWPPDTCIKKVSPLCRNRK
jgi:hypothetical protein